MNRAGVADHPRTWKHYGYHEIVKPKQRYRLIDVEELVRLTGMPDAFDFSEHYSGWVDNAIRKGSLSRDEIRTVELAVGSKSFVDMLRLKMDAAPLKEPVSHLHENPGGYGQDKRENKIEWEVFNSNGF